MLGGILVLAASEGVSAETIGEASLLLSDEEEENDADGTAVLESSERSLLKSICAVVLRRFST